jgi:DNA-binding FrmR family transcriptional regulator
LLSPFLAVGKQKGFGVEFLEGVWNTHTFSGSAIDERNPYTNESHHQEQLVLRAKRIQGQVEALVGALGEERDCSEVLQLMSAARGAMNSLMAELLEGHIRNQCAQ